ncbi:alpha/beta hydrolase [Methylicorpusculum oleiharenae]|uniref:esterase/lipase family protein n=1 Tax=Methylicorpusculum oleiharenae TaxID=1338687 RepID=UPI00135C4A63|nr:alpha/beta hydrolase [Methylicorpusculum oleiharenae]MCD2452326.1 alpha/beta hydrolase [Methylicorpusculum oleiharenae]
MTKTIASLPNKQRVTSCLNVFVFCLFGLLVEGCATPVGIDPVNIQTGYQLNTQNALSAGQPSEATKTVLRRNGLMDRFENEPETVLAELHAELKPMDDEDKLFTLAELSMLHAQKKNDQAYFLAAAVYAWSLLFPGDGHGVQLKASDPRYRLAYDLYNQGLAQGLAKPEDSEDNEVEVQLKPGTYQLPFGTLVLNFDENALFWGGYRLERFISTAFLDVRGLRNRYRTSGLGATLAASISSEQASNKVIGSERLGPRTKVPVTVIARLQHARSSLAGGQINGQLELNANDQATTLIVDGQVLPIESDPTAALALQLNANPLYSLEILNFLKGGLFSGAIPKDRANDGLFTLHPYRKGKIPLVLVHGTASSPLRWAEMINELEGDQRIRENYQVWFFIYDSANPVPYSAGVLSQALENALNEFDPNHKDPALQQMVVIGHSQGGLLTKMMAIDTGNRLWDLTSDKPFDQIMVSPDVEALLKRTLFFKPLPFVKRVIFISTPHHGAMAAASAWVTGLVAKLVTLPQSMIRGFAQAAAASGDEKLLTKLRRPPTAADNMNPNNPGLKTLASIPVASHIPAHSIIAVDGDGPKEEGDDGVVAYQSAHIDEAISEKVVNWNHSCQGQPEVIEEVRRILLEHSAVLGAQ